MFRKTYQHEYMGTLLCGLVGEKMYNIVIQRNNNIIENLDI